ncbi:hypothetical protein NC653_007645 [Populus alba x Populus x berolinensis]|uniref:Uncharacterized protein n=1 Tax=Populus alba x Populus x berolinensis TaxID=444605 RepID=A0AAD6RHY0_9ROSI|nr:hypothetical protein NC653_007645 [Populus alba x Populus x berolinensis]
MELMPLPATVILEGFQGFPHHDPPRKSVLEFIMFSHSAFWSKDLGTTHLSCMPVFSSDDITSFLRIALNSCLAEYASIVPE